MFYDYRSHSFTKLIDQFLSLIAENNPDDAFSKNWIIVQNREMQQWITLNQSLKEGISANNKFIFPSELIWKLYRLKDSDLNTNLASDLIPMQWSIFEELTSNKKLRTQLTGTNDLNAKLLLQQSKSIADVFDLYQVYRPDLIKSWERGQLRYNDDQERWQSDLWRSLSEFWNKDDKFKSRADAFEDLKGWMSTDEYPFEDIPQKIWIFGLPQISKPFAEIIAKLSRNIDCYNFNYLIEMNSEEKDQNLFLNKILKSPLNSNKILSDSLAIYDVSVNTNYDSSSESSAGNATNLDIIQYLLNNIYDGEELNSKDESIEIHSCHSVKREIEVLKDSLLNAFNSDSLLKPEDVLILVPNVEKYRAQIKEVFSDVHKDEFIPVNAGFEDINELRETTFLNVLSVLNSDFKVNSIIELLDNQILGEKWNISKDYIQLIREWAKDLHIHRFLERDVFSWVNGLQNLFLGFAMEADKFKLFQKHMAYDKINTGEATELVAKLSSFIDELKTFSRLTKSKFTVEEWLDKTRHIVNVFLLRRFDEDYNIKSLLSRIEQLKEQVQRSHFKGTIDFDVYLIWLKDHFSTSNSSGAGFGHGVTVREYVPNRSIPFKFVAVLGFNESVFPKAATRPDFDLINSHPEAGDRISIDVDRFLFYDMIQSAKQKLHFSYLGQDQYSENKKSPSILLQQLVDVARSNGISINIHEHKLHGYDSYYFKDQESKSFSKSNLEIAKNLSSELNKTHRFLTKIPVIERQEDERGISINDLVSFYSHPAKYLCTTFFGIRDSNDFQELEDREPFNLSGLDKYFLKDYLKEAFFSSELENLANNAVQRGLLPAGFPGELEFGENFKVVQQFNKVKEKYDFSLQQREDVEFKVEENIVFGTIGNIVENDRVVIRLGALKAKNLIDLWINHQVLNINKDITSRIFYIKNNNSVEEFILTPEHKDEEHLEFLIKEFKSQLNLDENWMFPVETSFEFAQAILRGDNIEKAIERGLEKWDGGHFAFSSEGEYFYNNLLLRDSSFAHKKVFQEKALKIWSPILNVTGAN